MSTITERAEAEAEAAEAEFPDEETQEAEEETVESPEPDTETPPAVLSEKQLEARMRKLDAENSRHATRVRDLLGEDAALIESCPCCHIPGFVFPFTEYQPDEETRKAATLAYFGAAAPQYAQHAALRECETCLGYGDVRTGSRRNGAETIPCEPCGGKGYMDRRVEQAQQSVRTDFPGVPALGYPGVGPQGKRDAYGRPDGHPRFGLPVGPEDFGA